MTSPHGSGSGMVVQQFHGVLADRLQHQEPFAAVSDQALVHQRLKYVDVSAGHSLSRVDGATTLEYRKSREEVDLRGIEQLAGPFDRCAQRLLTRLDAAVPARAEQFDRIERRHWRHCILGFSRNPKSFATSHEYVQIRAGLQHG